MSDHAPTLPPDPGPPDPDPPAPPARRRRSMIVWLLSLLVLGAGGAFAWWHWKSGPSQSAKAQAPAPRPVPVVAVKARQGDLPIYLNGLGTVTAFYTVTLRTRVDGQLITVKFTEGQLVHQDDLLAEIDPRPFQVQLEQAQGQLARDQALLTNARLDLQRYQQASEAIPRQQVDTAAALVAQYEGAIRVDQGQIDNANLQLTYARITAPISGTIGLRLVDPGNMVHAADATGLAVLTQLQPITVQFSLPQDDLPQVLHAQAAGNPPAEAYDRDLRNRLATGTLLAIDNQIDPVTGTVKIKALFENQDHALFPNQFVNVRLLVEVKQGAVLIPAAAVQRSPQSTFVYVVKADQTVEVRPITLGPTEGDLTTVSDGLAAGETVVTDGVDKLQNGSQVAAREPGAPPRNGGPAVNPGATTPPAGASGQAGEKGHGRTKGQGGR
jgi:multidrug efflux system membrane fusion protein